MRVIKSMESMSIKEAIRLYKLGVLSEAAESVLLKRLVEERENE